MAYLNKKQYAEFRAASEDKKRLDWLEKKRGDVQFVCGTHFVAGHPGMTRPKGSTVREAIDRAMQEEP